MIYSILLVSMLLLLSHTHIHGATTETLIGVVGKDFVMLGADRSVARSIVITSTEVDKIRIVTDQVILAGIGELADVEDLLATLKKQANERQLLPVAENVEVISLQESNPNAPKPNTRLSVSAMAKLARNVIAQRLRSRAPFQQLGLLMAGMQPEQPSNRKLWKSGVTSSAYFAEDVRKQLQRASSKESIQEDTVKPQESENNDSNNQQLVPCLFWLDEYGALQKVNYGIVGISSNFGLAVLDQGFRENMSREEAAKLIQNCFRQLQTRYLINSPKPPLIKCVDASGCHIYEP